MRFQGTLFAKLGKHGSRVERTFDVPWEQAEALEAFGEVEAPTKDDQQLWSAARYREGMNRGLAGIESLHAAVLDCDCADLGTMDSVCEALQQQGLAFIVYTSWSHGLTEKIHAETGLLGPFDCFRVVLPYSRQVSPEEHRSLVNGMIGVEVPPDPPHYKQEAIGRVVTNRKGTERMARPRGWDPVCERPAQGYYIPTPHSVFELHSGRPIDVDVVLARPTTRRPATIKLRPYQAPLPSAIGALGVLERALDKLLIGLGREGHAGWHRSVCPSCEDPSPSLTVRANGDGLDMHCHAGCMRRDILSSLGLKGELWSPPSQLQIELEDQLERQRPLEDEVGVDEAGDRLEAEIYESLRDRKRVVLKYPAGTGKSFRSARAISRLAREGRRICSSTQEHAVAAETRSKLDPDIRARSVHIHSPLIQVPNEPVCRRAAEVKSQVFDFGVSLMGQICPRCRFKDECEALAAAKDRQKRVAEAQVIFVSHAGIDQVFGVDSDGKPKGQGVDLIVDEMPGAFERVEVPPVVLSGFSRGLILSACPPIVAKVVQELATAILEGRMPGTVSLGLGRERGDAGEMAREWGRLSLRDGARPRDAEKGALGHADSLIRIYCHYAAGGDVEGLETKGALGVSAMLPDSCHEALLHRKGVLLSATPLLPALTDFELKEANVRDGAEVRRVMVLRHSRGSGALMESFYDDETGCRTKGAKAPGQELGIPWPVVDQALARALHEADRYGPNAGVLLVTFKGLADVLRSDGDRLADGRIRVAHYGALRGKNDWEEGKPDEVKVVYCLGTPRMNIRSTLMYLGLVGAEADEAWRDYAAGELAQAEGRLRVPRRKTSCTVVVEGDVAPSSWHPDNVDQLITDEDYYETSSGLLEAALVWRTLPEVSKILGVTKRSVQGWRQPGRPPPPESHLPLLRELAFPSTIECMQLLSRMSDGRKKKLQQVFSWEPLTDD